MRWTFTTNLTPAPHLSPPLWVLLFQSLDTPRWSPGLSEVLARCTCPRRRGAAVPPKWSTPMAAAEWCMARRRALLPRPRRCQCQSATRRWRGLASSSLGTGSSMDPRLGRGGGGFSRTRLRPCMTTAWRGRPHHHRWATGLPRHRRCRHLKRSKLRHRRHRLRHRRRPSDCRSRCGCRRDRMCAPWPRTDRQVLVSGEWLRDR